MKLWTGALSLCKCHWPDFRRELASSDGISSWTPLKPQHSNPNPNPLANQLWSIDFLTPLIIPHRHPAFLESLMPLKKLMLDSCKMIEKQSEAFHTYPWLFPIFETIFKAYRSSKVSSRRDCTFEIDQLWKSDFSSVYSNSCCSYSFEPEIIRIGQSSHNMYSNNIRNFPESTTILNAWTKSLETYWMLHTHTHTYIYI